VQVVVKLSGREPALPPGAAFVAQGEGWYAAEVEDRDEAERLAGALSRMAGVEAAYVKPGDELP
jgi:hypothetical protein